MPRSKRIPDWLAVGATIVSIAVVAVAWTSVKQTIAIRPVTPALTLTAPVDTEAAIPAGELLPGVPVGGQIPAAQMPDKAFCAPGIQIAAGLGRMAVWKSDDYRDFWLRGDPPDSDPERALIRKAAFAYSHNHAMESPIKLSPDANKLVREFGGMYLADGTGFEGDVGQKMREFYAQYFQPAADRAKLEPDAIQIVRADAEAVLPKLAKIDEDRYPKLLAALAPGQREALVALGHDVEAHPEKRGVPPEPADGVYLIYWAQAAGGYLQVTYSSTPGEPPQHFYHVRMPPRFDRALTADYKSLARLGDDPKLRAKIGLTDAQFDKIKSLPTNPPELKVTPDENAKIGEVFDAFVKLDDSPAKDRTAKDLEDAIRAAGRAHYADYLVEALKPIRALQAILSTDEYNELMDTDDVLQLAK